MALSCNNKAKGHWNVTFANTHITSSRCRVSQFARLFLRLSRPLLFLPSLNTYLYRQIHSVIIEKFLFSIFFFVLFLIYNNLVPIVIKKRRKGKKKQWLWLWIGSLLPHPHSLINVLLILMATDRLEFSCLLPSVQPLREFSLFISNLYISVFPRSVMINIGSNYLNILFLSCLFLKMQINNKTHILISKNDSYIITLSVDLLSAQPVDMFGHRTINNLFCIFFYEFNWSVSLWV